MFNDKAFSCLTKPPYQALRNVLQDRWSKRWSLLKVQNIQEVSNDVKGVLKSHESAVVSVAC